MTGRLLAIDIRGPGGHTLAEAWGDGPATYLGLMVAGLPNLFMINGPGSPSVKANMIVALEQHTDWIMGLIDHLAERGWTGSRRMRTRRPSGSSTLGRWRRRR